MCKPDKVEVNWKLIETLHERFSSFDNKIFELIK